MSWESISLEDTCTLITDGAHWSPKDIGEGFSMPSVKDMTENGFDFTKSKKISTDDFEKLKKGNCCPINGDVLIAKDGSYLKHCFEFKGEENVAILSSIAIFRPNQEVVLSSFLAYLFRTSFIREMAKGYVSGVAVPRIVLKDFKTLELPIPPLPTQKKIADILSAYDDLIENNLKRIKLLEEAAQNIYKEWFVKLRFPGHEDTTINAETGLPEGWEVCTINDVCEKVASGGTPSRKNKSYWDNPKYPWVTTKELRDGFILDVKESVSEEGLKNSSAKLFPKGTILMAIYASPTLGRLGILSRKACCNQAAVGFICDNTKISNQFLYYTLYSERANLNATAIGAAQQNINVGKVKAHEIILPPFHFVERFTSITSSNYEMRLNLVTQNQKLKSARDILLPRLMNQTIKV